MTAPGQPPYIGKETNRRWEQGEDISMLNPEVVEYRPNETARLVADPELGRDARSVSIRALAKGGRGEHPDRESCTARRFGFKSRWSLSSGRPSIVFQARTLGDGSIEWPSLPSTVTAQDGPLFYFGR